MNHKYLVAGCLAIAASALGTAGASAQDVVKIGIVTPMTGTSGAVGREISAAANLYMAQHGNMVAGKKSNSSSAMTPAFPTTPNALPRKWSSTITSHFSAPA